ncbi:MAG: diguanylate cyclase [Gammaproteobacteria bacterium]
MPHSPYRLHDHLLSHVYRRGSAAFGLSLLNAVLLAGLLGTEIQAGPLGVWLAGVTVMGALHWELGRRYLRRAAEGGGRGSFLPHVFVAAALGLAFGLGACLWTGLSTMWRMAMVLMLGAQAAGALPRLAAARPLYTAYLCGLFGPLVLMLVLSGEVSALALAPVLLLFCGSLLLSARHANADLMEALVWRFGLEEQAGEDQLTGIPNRRRFDTRLAEEWRRAVREQVPLSLILVDIDYFKRYNDRYGHQAGDDCLRQLAKALAGGAERAGDLVARYGGEEFAVVLFHATRDGGYAVAERLRQRIEALKIPHMDSIHGWVTASLGGATILPIPLASSQALVEAADQALYQAKAAGRNHVTWTSL